MTDKTTEKVAQSEENRQEKQSTLPETVGVVNPFALAEVRLGRRIDWKRIVNPRKVLERALETPYEKLFDPKFDSPLYPALRVKQDGGSVEIDKHFDHEKRLRYLYGPDFRKRLGKEGPPWVDPGHFFEDATDLFDPVQGALADCYFIAALSSVAWARPSVIVQRTRAISAMDDSLVSGGAVDTIGFYDDSGTHNVEVTELLPLLPPASTFIYGRCSELGETWPAVYEKAYAKWRTNSASDRPNYLGGAPGGIEYGDPVGAAAALTGLRPTYHNTAGTAPHDIWQDVRGNSLSRKTFNPVVAWTYGTAPPGTDYESAHVVANHAYSVAGWLFDGGQEYIVLRNPWGQYEATLNTDLGTWTSYDGSFWRPVSLPTGGAFAMRSDTFQQYFAGYGWVS